MQDFGSVPFQAQVKEVEPSSCTTATWFWSALIAGNYQASSTSPETSLSMECEEFVTQDKSAVLFQKIKAAGWYGDTFLVSKSTLSQLTSAQKEMDLIVANTW